LTNISTMRCPVSVRTLVLLVVTSGIVAYAQEYNFRSFGVSEGLTNLAVRKICQDRVGFIWVSTENGIFRYEGGRFETFGPKQGIPLNTRAAFGEAPMALFSLAVTLDSTNCQETASKNFPSLSNRSTGYKGSSRTGKDTHLLPRTPALRSSFRARHHIAANDHVRAIFAKN
jgi:hypothetical protein